ncbi:MAG: hypothetical protein ACYDAY_01145 [Candidatus Dormibacteria bacterium]
MNAVVSLTLRRPWMLILSGLGASPIILALAVALGFAIGLRQDFSANTELVRALNYAADPPGLSYADSPRAPLTAPLVLGSVSGTDSIAPPPDAVARATATLQPTHGKPAPAVAPVKGGGRTDPPGGGRADPPGGGHAAKPTPAAGPGGSTPGQAAGDGRPSAPPAGVPAASPTRPPSAPPALLPSALPTPQLPALPTPQLPALPTALPGHPHI